jgi:hypothetical protein
VCQQSTDIVLLNVSVHIAAIMPRSCLCFHTFEPQKNPNAYQRVPKLPTKVLSLFIEFITRATRQSHLILMVFVTLDFSSKVKTFEETHPPRGGSPEQSREPQRVPREYTHAYSDTTTKIQKFSRHVYHRGTFCMLFETLQQDGWVGA